MIVILHPYQSFGEVLAPPTFTDCTPTHGPQTGGTAVTFTGSGFDSWSASGATAGGEGFADFVVVNDTTITATSPVLEPGVYDITINFPVHNATLSNGWESDAV